MDIKKTIDDPRLLKGLAAANAAAQSGLADDQYLLSIIDATLESYALAFDAGTTQDIEVLKAAVLADPLAAKAAIEAALPPKIEPIPESLIEAQPAEVIKP